MNRMKCVSILIFSIILLLLFTSCNDKGVKDLEQAKTTISNFKKPSTVTSVNENQIDETEKTVSLNQTDDIFDKGDMNVIAPEITEKQSENCDINSLIDNSSSLKEQYEANTEK